MACHEQILRSALLIHTCTHPAPALMYTLKSFAFVCLAIRTPLHFHGVTESNRVSFLVHWFLPVYNTLYVRTYIFICWIKFQTSLDCEIGNAKLIKLSKNLILFPFALCFFIFFSFIVKNFKSQMCFYLFHLGFLFPIIMNQDFLFVIHQHHKETFLQMQGKNFSFQMSTFLGIFFTCSSLMRRTNSICTILIWLEERVKWTDWK